MWGDQLAIHCGGSPEKYPMPEVWQPVVVAQRTERRQRSEVECTTVSEGTEVVAGETEITGASRSSHWAN